MYKDMYTQYSNEDFEYSYPHCFNDNFKYLESNGVSTYTWDYGDTVDIPFEIDLEYRQCFLIKLFIYNFRHELIYEYDSYPDCCGKIFLHLSNKESEDIFKPGVYYCSIQACKYVSEDEDYTVTIMPQDKCGFYVR